jgi:hypothetical protein
MKSLRTFSNKDRNCLRKANCAKKASFNSDDLGPQVCEDISQTVRIQLQRPENKAEICDQCPVASYYNGIPAISGTDKTQKLIQLKRLQLSPFFSLENLSLQL